MDGSLQYSLRYVILLAFLLLLIAVTGLGMRNQSNRIQALCRAVKFYSMRADLRGRAWPRPLRVTTSGRRTSGGGL